KVQSPKSKNESRRQTERFGQKPFPHRPRKIRILPRHREVRQHQNRPLNTRLSTLDTFKRHPTPHLHPGRFHPSLPPHPPPFRLRRKRAEPDLPGLHLLRPRPPPEPQPRHFLARKIFRRDQSSFRRRHHH